MKFSQLKILLKEVVKEAIQEEFKEILLEAIKTPRGNGILSNPQPTQPIEVANPIPIQESVIPTNREDIRASYDNIMNETEISMNSTDVGKFSPQPGMDVANGTLPKGDVDIGQITAMLNGG